MKIAFVNFTPLVYTVDTPYEKPLGGSESSLCYLAETLAKLGHDVTLFARVNKTSTIRGVLHIPDTDIRVSTLKDLDILVIQNTPSEGPGLRALLSPKTKLILWTGHAPDQPAVSCLKDKNIHKSFDRFVFVSRIQLESYIQTFGVDRKKSWIIRNAISPAFENIYKVGENILSHKSTPAHLSYTSTPFRGLDFLLAMFPSIATAVPNVELDVYSGMEVYQSTPSEEAAAYGQLYQACQNTPGVNYIGSISQIELASKLSKVLVLSYPSTFAETSCIAVLEAMAAGCLIVTSNFGALPETTAGFAKLIDMTEDYREYGGHFISEVVSILRRFNSGDRVELNDLLTRQVAYINSCYTWSTRGLEWQSWLQDLILTDSE